MFILQSGHSSLKVAPETQQSTSYFLVTSYLLVHTIFTFVAFVCYVVLWFIACHIFNGLVMTIHDVIGYLIQKYPCPMKAIPQNPFGNHTSIPFSLKGIVKK